MVSPELRITLIQTSLLWEDPAANRQALESKIRNLGEPTDLIILPEMFTTGFTMNAEKIAETMEGKTVKWLLEIAKFKQAAITGSLIIKENGKYFNRLVWAQPDGKMFTYDKRHLFRMAGENGTFSAGKTRLLITWKGWKICPLICYDLRFPVWSRQNQQEPYDLLLYVANWPEKRATAWKTLLPARAIENLSYCVGVNRVGQDTNEINYSGNSVICFPQGETLFLSPNQEITFTQTLNYYDLSAFRNRFQANLDADLFELL